MPDQVVAIPGVGNVAFPDSMSQAQIDAASAKLYQEKQGAFGIGMSGGEHLARGPETFSDAPLPPDWKDRLNAAMQDVAHPQTFADLGHLIFQPGADFRGMAAGASAAVDALASGTKATGGYLMDLARNLPADLLDNLGHPARRLGETADFVREWSNRAGPILRRPRWQSEPPPPLSPVDPFMPNRGGIPDAGMAPGPFPPPSPIDRLMPNRGGVPDAGLPPEPLPTSPISQLMPNKSGVTAPTGPTLTEAQFAQLLREHDAAVALKAKPVAPPPPVPDVTTAGPVPPPAAAGTTGSAKLAYITKALGKMTDEEITESIKLADAGIAPSGIVKRIRAIRALTKTVFPLGDLLGGK